jgi:hypothetical protein
MLTSRNTAARGDTQHCTTCDSTAIIDGDEARAEFLRVRDWLHQQGVIFRAPDLPFRLTSSKELSKLVDAQGGVAFGITRTTIAGNRRPAITISMLSGLPRTLFAGSCAHELGHAWLQLNGIRGLPSIDEEGFCELLAWRYYTALNTPEGRYHAIRIGESSHPIYGGGFRKARALFRQYGFGQLVNLVAYYKRLPA